VSIAGMPTVTADPHLTHTGHLPTDHVSLRVSTNGFFSLEPLASGPVDPWTVPAGSTLVITDIQAVFVGNTPNAAIHVDLQYLMEPGNLLFYTPYQSLVLTDGNGNGLLEQHLTSGVLIPAGLTPRLGTTMPNTMLMKGYLVKN
jgi:hypothetical protein